MNPGSFSLTPLAFEFGALEPQAEARASALFVAVGHSGLRMASADGLEWKSIQVGKEGEVYRALRFGNGRFVAVGSYGGSNIFAASRDGLSWETKIRDGKYVKYVRGLGFGKGIFLGLGGDPGSVGSSSPFECHSADGVEWTGYRDIPGKNILRRVAFGNGRFVAVGDRGRRASSPDGVEWKDAPDVKAIDTLVDVAFGNGRFVGVGLHGLRMRTEDGLSWTDRQVGEEGEHLNTILWAGDRFVAVGMGATYSSRDGVSWTRERNRDAPLVFAAGNGSFVGAHWKGRILRSTDAVEWTQTYKSEHHVEAIAFGGWDHLP